MKTVFIVDPPSIPPIVGRSLGYYNYQVTSVQPNDNILDLLQTEKPDLVLIPFNMRGKPGLDIVRGIRQNPIPTVANTPVIVISDSDKVAVVMDQVKQIKQCNVNEFIIDPAGNIGLLIDRITLHISSRVESSWETLPELPRTILTQTLATINVLFNTIARSSLSASEVSHLKKNKKFNDKDLVQLGNGSAFSIVRLWNSFPMAKFDAIAENMGIQIVEQESHIDVLLRSLREHDNYNFTHCIRVALYLGLLLKHERVGYQDFSYHLSQMIKAALLHDIGHITVDKNLLHKFGEITKDERRVLQEHARSTEKIMLGQKKFSKLTAQTAAASHERLDGSGYPHKFDGAKLYPSARMIAIVDAYDAMSSKTPYRNPLTPVQAFAELRADKGKFDQKLVADFEELLYHMGSLGRP